MTSLVPQSTFAKSYGATVYNIDKGTTDPGIDNWHCQFDMVYTVDTVYTVDMVYTVDTVDTFDTVYTVV